MGQLETELHGDGVGTQPEENIQLPEDLQPVYRSW